MPHPIEEEDGSEPQAVYESDSDEVVDLSTSNITKISKAGPSPQQLPGTRGGFQYESQQTRQEASSVPLVVSDIVRQAGPAKRTALPAHKPTKVKEKTERKDKKRAKDPERLDQRPLAKKRKGNGRETPCVYCVRRLANDPEWVCREALVSQHGVANYKGLRCGGCVGAHVSCQPIPAKAIESVQTLVKAAADVVASEGTNKIQLLAAYEAAIGPALKDMIVIPDPHAPKPQKRHRKPSSSASQPPKSKQKLPNGSPPWPANPTPPFSSAGTGTSQQQQQQQFAQADHANSPAPLPLPHQQQQYHQDATDFERRERLALRRRKVEALESISHTAALLLAEFMAFTKRQNSSSSSSEGGAHGGQGSSGGGGGGGQSTGAGNLPEHNSGMVYAAAAAGMAASIFQPSASEPKDSQPFFKRTGTDAHLDALEDEDSDSDSSGASTIANKDRETVTDAYNKPSSGQGEDDDIGMLSGSDVDDHDDAVGDGGVIGKQVRDDDEGDASPVSEVKVEVQ